LEHDTGFRDTLSAPLQLLALAESGQTAVLPRDSERDWLYIRDAAAGIVSLMKTRHLPNRIYNVAAGFEFKLSSWCRMLQARFPGFDWRIDSSQDVCNVNLYGDQDRATMDIERLRTDTEFLPQYDIENAFNDFISWREQVSATKSSN
jgi:UDP-glucuronate 4-epimerase